MLVLLRVADPVQADTFYVGIRIARPVGLFVGLLSLRGRARSSGSDIYVGILSLPLDFRFARRRAYCVLA